MPSYRTPGVYVEDTPIRTRRIDGIDTGTCAFVGPTHRGPSLDAAPPLLTSLHDFEQAFGDATDLAFDGQATPHYLAHAVRAFFAEGGKRLYVSRVAAGADGACSDRAPQASDYAAALAALHTRDDVRIVAAPGASAWCDDPVAVAQALVAHVGQPRTWRFAVLDPPRGAGLEAVMHLRRQVESSRAALYFPWIATADPAAEGAPRLQPPSGFICGIYARTDAERGVHMAPANQVIASALGFERTLDAQQQEQLNPAGVNCLRSFTGRGHRVWGARTASTDPEWKYVNVRRYCDFLEASIDRGLQWAVFEENGPALWTRIRSAVNDFLDAQWRKGALAGSTPAQAWFVRCDATTTTRADLDRGRVVCQVGVAITHPAEFRILQVRLQVGLQAQPARA